MSYINVEQAIKEAEAALARKDKATQNVAIIRTDLRNAIALKAANAEQAKWIEEHFPARERNTDPKAKADKLRQQLREAEEAAKAA